MIKVSNLMEQTPSHYIKEKLGAFSVVEYVQDLSVRPETAQMVYFSNLMNIRKRKVLCNLNEADITVQAGAMHWMVGDCQVKTGVKGAGDLMGKMMRGKATGEAAIKPEYTGSGLVVLEPTYKHIILSDITEWGGAVTLQDGLFLACESCLAQRISARSNLSSAALGGEGLFNLALMGNEGVFALESPCPKEELVVIDLVDDVLKVDGNFAIAWTCKGLDFTVERTTKSLIGSAASGEGLVNVYRGTGRVWLADI